MIKAVIFDMDGVLVDSEPVYFERQLRFMKALGVTPATTNIQDYVGKPSDVVWADAIPDLGDRQRVRQAFEASVVTEPIDFRPIVNPGIPELLAFLKANHYRTALASAGPLAGVQRMLAETDLKPYFDSVISGETITRNKPDPQIYLESLAAIDVAPEEGLAVEDSLTGITAAKRAGMRAWAIKPRAYQLDQRLADFVAVDANEIRMHLMVK